MFKKQPVLFLIILIFLFFCFAFLHYKQVVFFDFKSDWRGHIGFASNYEDKGFYSLLHFIVLFVSKVFFYLFPNVLFINIVKTSMILVVAFSEILTVVLCYLYFLKILKIPQLYSFFISIALSFVSMLIYKIESPLYLGSGSPNVWHNPTFNFSKPFAIIYFLGVLEFFKGGFKTFTYNNLICVSIAGILCVWAKPSFIISFLPASFFLLGLFYIRQKLVFNDLVRYLILVVPPFLVLILMIFLLNNSSSYNTIIFKNGEVWKYYSKNIMISILLGALFPISLFLFNKTDQKTDYLIWINFIIGAIVYYILAESGDRKYDGNFAWTYSFSLFILFLGSIEPFYKLRLYKMRIYNVLNVFFLLHLISGLLYFIKIFFVGIYY